jgi:hypothetical protein
MSTENTENTGSKLIVILDPIGRTILGEKVCCGQQCNEDVLKLKNPVVLHIVPADNQGKMSVQLLPLFFREFLADKSGDVVFTFEKTKVVTTDIDALDFRLQGQYAQMFNPQNVFVNGGQQPAANPNDGQSPTVVSLFDE